MFKTIYFDISGVCNAHCRYCVSGKKSISGSAHRKQGSFIGVQEFHNSIEHMLNKGVISCGSEVVLYSWGEPFLHKELKEIIEIIKSKGLYYNLSTNASKCTDFNKDELSNLKSITFSMPGFSQASYDRIHGFKFDRIIKNISDMALSLRENNYVGEMVLAYHIYKFNLDEINSAAAFAKKNDMVFVPSLAYLNGYDMFRHFLTKNMSPQHIEMISTEVFTDHLRELQLRRPANYICPQFERLSIDENSNVLMCCAMEKACGEQGLVGNLFDMDLIEIQKKRNGMEICNECSSLSIDYIAQSPVGIIEFLRFYGDLFNIVDFDTAKEVVDGDIYIYGTGETADSLFNTFLQSKSFNVKGVVYSSSIDGDSVFNGFPVDNPNVLHKKSEAKILIASLSEKSINEIQFMLRDEFELSNPILKFKINV